MRFVDPSGRDIGHLNEWLTFNDLLLVPQYSAIPSRNDPRLTTTSKIAPNVNIGIPIIATPMDTICGADMAIAMNKMGGLGILHRFFKSKEEFMAAVSKVIEQTKYVAISIGSTTEIDIIQEVLNKNPTLLIVNIDTANGHNKLTIDQVKRIKDKHQGVVKIIAGNVVTDQGAANLLFAGADAIRCNIGNGSRCSTRLVSGHGLPSVNAILECRKAINELKSNAALIADGGCTTSGDIVKALALGADCVMVGGLIAGTNECPGSLCMADGNEPIKPEDYCRTLYKKYRGQASQDFMDDIHKTDVAPEGISSLVESRGPVAPIIQKLVGGIRSGMSYTGAWNLEELNRKAVFARVSHASYIESLPKSV